ncbi:LysE family transporter [Fulvivirga sp. 29W222]|uniref:LysE family transporter n=1 Tax=Fulvivirga marina TaxID=2494733 RepID=A0A937KE30_9BACT|nr:LysE family transporter [Fulvivirga marina]MBL6449716.1 LysE family transporter [Fulvivirga marina]
MTLIFSIAFIFSFLGSIPPGSINLSVIQLSLDSRLSAALRFALAAALIEYPYAFIAVQFEGWITSSPVIINNFKLIAASVMLLLGVVNLWPQKKSPSKIMETIRNSGFRKGVIISLLNPLAIPFWIGVTAYLNHQGWINLETVDQVFVYVLGISVGTFFLLALLALLAKKLRPIIAESEFVKLIPGIVFLILGSYALLQYFELV